MNLTKNNKPIVALAHIIALSSINKFIKGHERTTSLRSTLISKTEEYVCLNALISGTTSRIWEILLAFDNPNLEEGYGLLKHTLRLSGAE